MLKPTDESWLDLLRWDERGLVTAVAQDAIDARVLMVAWMNREALQRTVATGQATYWSRSRQRLWRKGEESGHTQTVREIRADCDGDTVLLSVIQHGGVACHTGRATCFFNRLSDDSTGAPVWTVVDPVLKSPPPNSLGQAGTDTARAGSAAVVRAAPGAVAAAPKAVAATPEALAVAPEAVADPEAFSVPATAVESVLARLAAVIDSRRQADPNTSYVARLLCGGEDALLKKIGEEATETVIAAKNGSPDRIVAETADLWFHSLVVLARYGLGPKQVLAELARREGLSGIDEKAARLGEGSAASG